MSSSSLIFLVIVIIWAAYLLQHWVRRREHLATARSVDRFSEGMRVLERRPTSLHGATEAADAEHGAVLAATTEQPRPTLRAGAPMTHDEFDEPPNPSRTNGSHPIPAARDAQSPVEHERVKPQQVRAAALVGTVALFALVVVLTPFGITPWWTPLLMLVGLGGVVAWLRSAAVKAAYAAHAETAPARPERRPAPRRAPRAERTAPAGSAEVYDDAPATERTAPAAAEEISASVSDDPHAWKPVEVPPPTYTLKAKAERPEPVVADEPVFDAAAHEPVSVEAEPTPAQAPVAEPEPAAEPEQPAYAQMAVEDLPFDGLALDEELEDLPPVHRAG
ncbi:hypothetical protein [Luteipulveratus halotolerans]|uniref:Uncharacterized protein n=1 Tax=Luteipulveratus halotolerans TaxID=1631356 RepID=A0A0L6CKL3_9MICO|nr:hypothetical protein [Luteipulveratus halotolerans]KNX38043.1 hypothetical protein VV01_14255 [Luteipulveratus halotolerans]